MILSENPKIEFHNNDCLEAMKNFPDNHFDIAIVDPPYGQGEMIAKGGGFAAKYLPEDFIWDIKPSQEYFDQLMRISKSQIIFGGNFFSNLPACRGFIIWDKMLTDNWTMAMAEFIWTSYDRPSKIYRGKTDNGNQVERIHICQKPIKLYKWILHHYAYPGMKILDTHLGSASSAIASYHFGCEFIGYELSKKNFDLSVPRFKKLTIQKQLFEHGKR